MELRMSKTSPKIALAFFVFLTAPAASFAMVAGEAGAGNLAINGIAPGPANAVGVNNVLNDPSGIENASKVPPLPPPHITVPVVPKFK
jgi:hypothetical protein